MNRTWRLAAGLSLASLVWCVVAGLLLWFLPLGSSSSASSSGVAVEGGQSFASISALGPVPLIIPVALAGIGAWAAYHRHNAVLAIAAIAAALFSFLTGFSIGLIYVPAVATLFAATIAAFGAGRQDARGAGGDSST